MGHSGGLSELSNFAQASQRIRDIIEGAHSPEQSILGLLELGETKLDVENAHLSRIEPEANYWEAIASTDQQYGLVVPGQTIDLDNTFCRHVIHEDHSVAISHASDEGWGNDPAYKQNELECYLGIPVTVGETTIGTACFIDRDPRSDPFACEEAAFAELVSFQIGRLLEQRRIESQIERLEEMNTVLGRILRHNLRNELTVIRGQIELLIDQLDGDFHEELDRVIERIDALEALADKSRDINTILSPVIDREHIEFTDLIIRIINHMQAKYPDAEFQTSLSEITIPLAGTIERALKELIENAAKHGGDPAEVTIQTETEENAVVVDIADNGPGLPEQERRVFENTGETPLEHGSGIGLWLVSWIVGNHDGEIAVLEFVDGTRIRLRLPYTGLRFT